ncbi:MAG: hypothetical protein Q4G43_10110 [Mobilicoccus sp.]|nr:hypothetical protein [Mobilicoccus sp.]
MLQVTERHRWNTDVVAPVEVDLTGDGGLDLVGVLSCTRDGVELPDSIVLYTGPASPAATLDLAAGQEGVVTVVRSMTTIGGDVRVQWTAMTGGQESGQYQATVTWTGTGLELVDVAESSGPRTVTVENGSFMSPDGNVHCVLHGALGWCDVSETTWTPPSPPPPTPVSPDATGDDDDEIVMEQACDGRPFGKTFLINGGRATQTCRGEQGPETATLGAPLTAWHRNGWDAVVVVDGRRSAALAAGSTMRTAAISCEAATAEITCTDTRTQASFTVGRATSRVSSP